AVRDLNDEAVAAVVVGGGAVADGFGNARPRCYRRTVAGLVTNRPGNRIIVDIAGVEGQVEGGRIAVFAHRYLNLAEGREVAHHRRFEAVGPVLVGHYRIAVAVKGQAGVVGPPV